MTLKALPAENEILTRTGKVINPLNVQLGDISILDVVHALPLFPMFGGQTRKFYSMAEHSVNMYDYFDMYQMEVIEKFERKSKNAEDEDTMFISDIKQRHLRLFTLLYYSPYPILLDIIGGFKAWNYHYPRVLAIIVQSIGLEYEQFKMCKKMLDYVDKEVRKSVYGSFNATNDKYLFLSPFKAQEEYISRFNKDSDIEIRTHGNLHYLAEIEATGNGQTHLCFDLPTTTI